MERPQRCRCGVVLPFWRGVVVLAFGWITAAAQISPPAGRLANLSARAPTSHGDGALTAGFFIAGPGAKRVLVRAAGPSLTQVGLPGALQAAKLELYQGSTLLATNTDWDAGAAGSLIAQVALGVGAFPFVPGSADAALVVTLNPGGYTARIVPARESTAAGVALVEVYDADPQAPARLINLSARARSGTGADALFAGFVVAGEGRNRLLVRAAGPALGAFGLREVLEDPQLEVFQGELTAGFNDDWEANTNAAQLATVAGGAGAFPFASGAKDAALLVPATRGAYTAMVSGATAEAGVALVEVYDTAALRSDFQARTFDLIGFARVPGHGLATLTGGGAPGQPFDPQTRTGNYWRIDEATAATPEFPAQFQTAMASDAPLVVELDTMLDLSRVALPSNGATAIAHPDLFASGRTNGVVGLLGLGSNKTIYSAYGAGGFRRGTLRIDGANNIILRNLRFRELWEWDDATAGQYDRNDWDYITILSRFSGSDVTARAHHIWIDHCDFEKSYDGLVDVLQGADLITISWCKFAGVMSGETARWVKRQMDYVEENQASFPSYRTFRTIVGAAALRNRERFQFKGNLVGNSVEALTAARDRGHLNVTFHHNWYARVDERMPRLRFGNAHVFNLLADSSATGDGLALAGGGIIATSGAAVRVENSWFTNVRMPVSVRVGAELPGTIMVRDSVNFDAVVGRETAFDSAHVVPAGSFAWNRPDPRTGISNWPAADPGMMPAGYTPAGTTLVQYMDAAEFMVTNRARVGVLVPADAAEAQIWRSRWQSIGP